MFLVSLENPPETTFLESCHELVDLGAGLALERVLDGSEGSYELFCQGREVTLERRLDLGCHSLGGLADVPEQRIDVVGEGLLHHGAEALTDLGAEIPHADVDLLQVVETLGQAGTGGCVLGTNLLQERGALLEERQLDAALLDEVRPELGRERVARLLETPLGSPKDERVTDGGSDAGA